MLLRLQQWAKEHTSSSKKRVGEAATARRLFSEAGLSEEVAEPECGLATADVAFPGADTVNPCSQTGCLVVQPAYVSTLRACG